MRHGFTVLTGAVGAGVVIGGLGIGAALAADPTPSVPTRHQAMVASLAQSLGVSAEKVDEAMDQAHGQMLAEAIKTGQITQQQADWMNQRHVQMEQGGGMGFGPGAGAMVGWMGGGSHGHGLGAGQGRGGAGPGMGPGSGPGVSVTPTR